MLLCVALSYEEHDTTQTIEQLLPNSPLAHITTPPVAELTQRQLLDQVECLQLYWGQIMEAHTSTAGAIRALMRRLGHLARHAFPMQSATQVLDSAQYTVPLPGGVMCIVSRRYLRRLCCVFLLLMRALYVTREAEWAEEITAETADEIRGCFHEHHLECSVDAFATLQQMVQLAPAMRLVYRMDFNGMYNDVSQVLLQFSLRTPTEGLLWEQQVVFFHYPQFQRQPQASLALSLCSALHTLPIALQLLPTLPVVYDDEVSNSFPKSYITRHTIAPFMPLSSLLLGAPRLGYAQ